ncbi:gluconate 2-dehydrogenase subunit 3 family protein [Spirosoma koreense]
MQKHYPEGTVRALLQTRQVTEATRQALTERLTAPDYTHAFFAESEFLLLEAICDRLLPQDNGRRIPVAPVIDQRLAENGSDGWRYDVMPPDGMAYKAGLAAVNETANLLFRDFFINLSADQQDDVLRQVQQGDAPGDGWKKLPAGRFFEELLTEAAHAYYSHPLAQEEIGYVGMADVPGWQKIGLNQLEDREPKLMENE